MENEEIEKMITERQIAKNRQTDSGIIECKHIKCIGDSKGRYFTRCKAKVRQPKDKR